MAGGNPGTTPLAPPQPMGWGQPQPLHLAQLHTHMTQSGGSPQALLYLFPPNLHPSLWHLSSSRVAALKRGVSFEISLA